MPFVRLRFIVNHQDRIELQAVAEKLDIGFFQRHVFLCIGQECCDGAIGEAAWDKLKTLMKKRGLSLSREPNACYRTKVGCLRVCQKGPILVVYPEGTWYFGMTEDKIERFVQEHLVDGQPIEDWIFARNPLPKPLPNPSETGNSAELG